jgi:O-antigen ligase
MAAASTRNRYLFGVWIMLAILTPLSGFLGARGFAPEVGIAGLLCVPLARPRDTEIAGLILFALLAEWALISAFWSPAPLPHDLHSLGRFTGLHVAQQVVYCGALIVTARTLPSPLAARALKWMAVGLLLLATILLFESLTDALARKTVERLAGQKPSDITHWELRAVAQGGYAMAALFWPVSMALAAQRRRLMLAAFIVLCLADLVLLDISALILSLLISAVVFFLARWRGRIVALACMAVAVLQTLLVPWLLLWMSRSGLSASLAPHLPKSWSARLRIWDFASTHMAQKPLFGWGLDSSRTFGNRIPLHPHDAALQLWFELGVPGALIGAAIWGFVFWRLVKAAPDRPRFAATGCAVGTVCLTIGAFSFGLWQEWWLCLMALAFAACVVLGRQMDEEPARA